ARVEEAVVVDRFAGGGLVLGVAEEDMRTPDEDLAVRGDPDLGSGNGPAGPAEAVAVRQGERRGPRALALAVDLEDPDPEALEEVEGLACNRRRRHRADPRAVEAEPRPHAVEHQRLREAVEEGPRASVFRRAASRAA